MASSRDSSNAPDWKDLASILDSFEKQDSVKVSIYIETTISDGVPDLTVHLDYCTTKPADAALVRSGSVSATCSATNRTTLEAVVLRLLYTVDFQLALGEYEVMAKSG